MACELDNWYARDNGVCRSFFHLYAQIIIGVPNHLIVYDSNLNTKEFEFDSFSDAVCFANRYVSRSHSLEEVNNYHNQMILKMGGF